MADNQSRPVPGWPDVSCTRDGQITGPSGKVLKHYICPKSGHRHVLIRNRKLRVHHAVLLTYVGPRPLGMNGLHRDDDQANNTVENLYWGTHLDNAADRRRNKGFSTRSRCPRRTPNRRSGPTDSSRHQSISRSRRRVWRQPHINP